MNMKPVTLLVILGTSLLPALPASAQMNNQPWGFTAQNRASIASLIHQVENEDRYTGVGYAMPSLTNLVCGSGGEASASGNTTCVILNNSNGTVDIGQESNGSQTATSSSSQTTNSGSIDEVAEALAGK